MEAQIPKFVTLPTIIRGYVMKLSEILLATQEMHNVCIIVAYVVYLWDNRLFNYISK